MIGSVKRRVIVLSTLLTVLASVGAQAQTERRSGTPAPLQQMIEQALKSHPEVVAARASVAEAQARLERVRLEVAHRIIDHQKSEKTLELQLEAEKAKLGHFKRQVDQGLATADNLQVQESIVRTVAIELSSQRARLPLLLGGAANGSNDVVAVGEELEKAEAMVAHAQQAYDAAAVLFKGGMVEGDELIRWSKRLFHGQERVHGTSLDAARRHLDRMKTLLAGEKARYEGGFQNALNYAAAQFAMAEAELMVAERE